MRIYNLRKVLKFAALPIFAATALAGLTGSYLLPLGHDAIQYDKLVAHDAVTALQARVDSGAVNLAYEEQFGYLRAVLKALKVPESSQVLVFSKTSVQAARIAPHSPRAIYFNDTVQVAFVREGEMLEIAALDPRQGTVFYTLDQTKTDQPQFGRSDSCLQCHQSGATYGVPGLVVRSVFPDSFGMPLFHAGTFTTDHRSGLKDRWGGWYVTGTTGSQRHMGNAIVPDPSRPGTLSVGNGNLSDLRGFIGTGRYLTPHSDVVALMTLEHQTQMVNLITRVGWETRMALYENEAINRSLKRPADDRSASITRRIDNAAEELVQYLLFRDEQPLADPVRGTSPFAAEFPGAGPRDSKGRSLRDFDLRTRLFRYPCSYMIYSDAFEALPKAAQSSIYRQLFDILTLDKPAGRYAMFARADREALFEIIRDTKKELPSYWARR